MKVIPYIQFNGNCIQAITLYEKVFGVEAEISRYKDAPPSAGHVLPEGTEDYVMHAHFVLGGDMIMLCDMPPTEPVSIGNNIAISISFEDTESVINAFNELKVGGKAGMEPQETFWSKCFAIAEDKFGINWMLSHEYCIEQ